MLSCRHTGCNTTFNSVISITRIPNNIPIITPNYVTVLQFNLFSFSSLSHLGERNGVLLYGSMRLIIPQKSV